MILFRDLLFRMWRMRRSLLWLPVRVLREAKQPNRGKLTWALGIRLNGRWAHRISRRGWCLTFGPSRQEAIR